MYNYSFLACRLASVETIAKCDIPNTCAEVDHIMNPIIIWYPVNES